MAVLPAGVKNTVVEEDMARRASGAYVRMGGASLSDQPHGYTIGDKEYVVLHNSSGLLAVYRVRNDGVLKRLRRWPSAIDEIYDYG